MKEPALIESVTRYSTLSYKVRVWRKETELGAAYPETEKVIGRALEGMDVYAPSEFFQIIEALSDVEGITAFEIRNSMRDGVVVYLEWP